MLEPPASYTAHSADKPVNQPETANEVPPVDDQVATEKPQPPEPEPHAPETPSENQAAALDLGTATSIEPNSTLPPPEAVLPIPAMRYIVPPGGLIAPNEIERSEFSMVKVILRTSGDKQRDVRRLRRIHGILRSHPGQDKFAMLVFEGPSRYLVEFPNDTTGICSELLSELTNLLGEGSVLIETIPLQ
jgi:DNA polymerase-3 subunit alpha